MYLAFFILNRSIGWTASLDEPASVNLPLITEERGAVVFGYGTYLAYSLLIAPLAVMLYFVLGKDDEASPLLAVAAAVGVMSALARSLGIGRWLFAMPFLAEIYLDPSSGEATRQAVSVAYVALNEYSGRGRGAARGVSLTGALWVGLVSVAMLRSGRFPRWLGVLGLLAALLLLQGPLSVVGLGVGLIFAVIGGNVLLVWMLALAIVLFTTLRRSFRLAA